jgi:hypothetical protein
MNTVVKIKFKLFEMLFFAPSRAKMGPLIICIALKTHVTLKQLSGYILAKNMCEITKAKDF